VTYLLDTNAIDLMRANPQIEAWMSGLDEGDRLITCTIVRGEILFWDFPAGRREASSGVGAG
jgi:predicted nucleic acid-binding protein